MARKNTSITGRDGFIVPQAVLYGIGYIQSLPRTRQEWSNMLDMCKIVRSWDTPFTIPHMLNLEQFHGFKIDLWPEDDADLSESEKAKRDEFRQAHKRLRDQHVALSIEHAQPFCLMPTPSFAGYDEKYLTGTEENDPVFIEDGNVPAPKHPGGFIGDDEDTGVGAPPDEMTEEAVLRRVAANMAKADERLNFEWRRKHGLA